MELAAIGDRISFPRSVVTMFRHGGEQQATFAKMKHINSEDAIHVRHETSAVLVIFPGDTSTPFTLWRDLCE